MNLFQGLSKTSTKLLGLIPAVMCANNVALGDVFETYRDDFPSPKLVQEEYKRWKLR